MVIELDTLYLHSHLKGPYPTYIYEDLANVKIKPAFYYYKVINPK